LQEPRWRSRTNAMHYACMVQEGQIADRMRDRLGAGLRQLAAETFGEAEAEVEIRWVTIAKGFGFTAGKPSTSSLIARSAPAGFGDDERRAFMSRVSDLWREVTGCHPDEVVVTTLGGPLPRL
jgi:hypothetical protein